MRILLGAFGDPGHAFPMLALGSALRARGHDVTLQTWQRWQADAEREGLTFAPAPEYPVFPTQERPLRPYEAVARATVDTRPLIRTTAPDVVVADILTLAPALAAELEGVRVATLIPHFDPRPIPGAAPYALGARLPRGPLGRSIWRGLDPLVRRGLERGRSELNETRRRLGLPAQDRVLGGISERLALVATLPQLEYPRVPPPGTHVVGPLLWEPPSPQVAVPPGDGPLVLVAPSTAQDPGHRLVRSTLDGLAGLAGVRVLAVTGRTEALPGAAPRAGMCVVGWASYAATMPRCDVVVTHGGNGTLCRALASGCPVVVAPGGGDQNESAARVDWSGLGVRVPRRLASSRSIRLAVQRALEDEPLRARVGGVAAAAATADPGRRAAELIEAFGTA